MIGIFHPLIYHSNWGEPERAPHKRYTESMRELYIMVCPSREIYAQHGSMDTSAKYSIAHSVTSGSFHMYTVLI
jgi:hypothetical protein